MTELNYVDNIPQKTKSGKDWTKIFEAIPTGKALEIPRSFAIHQTVKNAVKNYNKNAGKIVFVATARNYDKDSEVTFVYRTGEF